MEYSSSEELPARSTTDVLFTYTDSGRVKNTLQAQKVDQYVYEDSTFSKITGGFVLTFFDFNGQVDGRLSAQNAVIFNNNSKMIARDSVVFVNDADETLKTEELIWIQDSAIVYTDKFVTIERSTGVIYGKGLRANENFTNYEIQQTTGEFYIDDTEK